MKVKYDWFYSEQEYNRYEKFVLLKGFLGIKSGTILKYSGWRGALMFGGGWRPLTENGYFNTSVPQLSRTFILLHRKYFKVVAV